MDRVKLPELMPEYESTRATLHAYARSVGVVARTHGIAHPKWWHTSLKVRPEGLVTDPVPLPGGGSFAAAVDVRHHEIVLRASTGWEHRIDLRAGETATAVGDGVIAAVAGLGLDGEYDRSKFENDDPRIYDPSAAEAYFEAFVAVDTVFERHRVSLGDRVSPIQVWPHGFDLSFEWFGTRTEEQGGEKLPAQLNLGFYPGSTPYFYSNPWPFDEGFIGSPLPHGAQWHTEGSQGTMLERTRRSPPGWWWR